MALVSEMQAEVNAVVWLGERKSDCSVVCKKKSDVWIRGRVLRLWKDEGQQKRFVKRIMTVDLGCMRLEAVYQPSNGMDEEGIERYRGEGREKLVIEDDFNVGIGRDSERLGL